VDGEEECDDVDACTDDACDVASHTCSHETVTCTDSDECTIDGCDAYPVVRPDQTAYFVEPYSCPGGVTTHPSYDYNCDGVDERRYTTAGSCTASSGGCVVTDGWRGDSIPGCGHSGEWLSSCAFDPTSGTCAPNAVRSQIQTCR
jgi:hypothetical protein